nr:TerB family tellurite resistance protein [Pedobacter sp. ASV19]
MKKLILTLLFVLPLCLGFQARAQTDEIAQLVLNVEKLAQFKQILSDMKKGYDVLHGGYSTIKDISEGNFSLHKFFLDALLEASPTVRQYYKVPRIISYQVALVKEYKAAFGRFRQSNLFNPQELNYLGDVYSNLLNHSLRNLDELAGVVTSGKLRMSDDERLKAIDQIYTDMEEKVLFLRSFNNSTSMLALQRDRQMREIKRLQQLNN